MWMNSLSFPDNAIHILWTLQLCLDKSANWKQTQMELMQGIVRPPNYLQHWDDFQTEFLLKWANMNSQKKACARFLASLKQTTLVRQYVEIFEDLALEADFTDLTILHTAFYKGLKWDVRRDMVGKTPDMLVELKALVIQLDEEHMGADCCKTQTANNRTTITNPNELTCHTMSQVKAEVACVGMSLSTDDWARYLWEGHCFGCGKTGHQQPECPDGKPQVYISAIKPIVRVPEPTTASEQSKN
jgi:hypothetical protein